jgi:hypothetical protein
MIRTEKWAFCHIPKNGGTNFVMRSPYEIDKILNNISRHNLPSYFNDVDVPWIAIIRNPYSRYVSWYFFTKNDRQKRPIHIQNKQRDYTFEEFVRTNLLKKPGAYADKWIASHGGEWHRWWPQHYWTDHGVKTFKLETDLEEMEDYVGFCFSDTKYNSTEHEDWQKYYTDDLKDIVYNRFKMDFDIYEYKK